MAEALDVNTLKRRSRRRLVGAVALVLLAVIVLPMVFDTEPRQTEPSVSVRIPPEDDAKFTPRLETPPTPSAAAPSAPAKAEGTPTDVKPAPSPAARAPVQPQAKVEPAPPRTEPKPVARSEATERARAEAALKNVEYVVPVVALANADQVKEQTARLAAVKMPYYTEPVATAQGAVTRIRAGPFADRATAENAVEKLKGMGFNPGKVLEKP
jgi:DedD protein